MSFNCSKFKVNSNLFKNCLITIFVCLNVNIAPVCRANVSWMQLKRAIVLLVKDDDRCRKMSKMRLLSSYFCLRRFELKVNLLEWEEVKLELSEQEDEDDDENKERPSQTNLGFRSTAKSVPIPRLFSFPNPFLQFIITYITTKQTPYSRASGRRRRRRRRHGTRSSCCWCCFVCCL